MKVLSLCDGMSIAHIALDKIGIPVEKYYAAEIKPIAIKVTKDNYPDTIHIGDVNKISYKAGILYTENGNYNVGHIDLMVFGSPCFVGNTLVLTQDGYKNIKDIRINDYVLSHDNQMHQVVNWGMTGVKQIWNIKAMGSDEIRTTENHKFLVRKMVHKWDKTIHHDKRMFLDPEWIEAKNLDKTYYMGYAINMESKLPEWNGVDIWKQWNVHHKQELDVGSKDFWYIVGRWLGDGWLLKNRPGKYRSKYNGVKICCSKEETDYLAEKISKVFHYVKTTERTVDKFQIMSTEFSAFLSQFGDGAKNKFIPKFVMDLPVDLLLEFLDGYFDSDGCYDRKTDKYKCSSVSRELIYGIGQCVAKVFHRPFTILKHIPSDKKNIEGRIVNQNPYWILEFKIENGKQDQAFYEDGYIWTPIRTVCATNNYEEVYDITVEDSHSFTANGVIAHNCQSFSRCMKTDMRVGLEDKTRSGLFFECYRILQEVQPTWWLLENVASMKNEDRDYLSECMGVEPIRINSKLVCAALRDRYYWTNIPGITQPGDKGITLQSILTSGYTDREKARTLLVSDSRPLRDKQKMLHRYKKFTTIVWEEKGNDDSIRYLNQTELERLQNVPEGYTKCLTRNEAADVLGDSFTVDVIAHIFSFINTQQNDLINEEVI